MILSGNKVAERTQRGGRGYKRTGYKSKESPISIHCYVWENAGQSG